MKINYDWENKNIITSSFDEKDEVIKLIFSIQNDIDPLDGVVFFQSLFKNYHINLKTPIDDIVRIFYSYSESKQEELKTSIINFIQEQK